MLNRAYLRPSIAFLGIIPLSVLMKVKVPADWAVPYFKKPILAFEFAKSQLDLDQIFRTTQQEQFIAQLNQLNYWDFLFMGVYGVFLLLFLRAVATEMPVWLNRLLIWMVPLIICFDVMENLQLFEIARHITAGNEHPLYMLMVFTWLKWGCLAFLFCGLSAFWLKGPWLFRPLGLIGIVNIGFGVMALCVGTYWYERFASLITISFAGAFFYSLRQLFFSTHSGKWY